MRKMKFIDLSIPIINPEEAVFDPPLTQPKIEYSSHEEGAMQMGFLFPRLKPERHLPDGKGWAQEFITLGTHSGTHMDAPWHYAPIQDNEIERKKALTIEDFPLEWGIGPLIVLDCTNYKEGYIITPDDVDDKLSNIGYKLNLD